MKYRFCSHLRPVISGVLVCFALVNASAVSTAQEKKPAKTKAAAPSKTTAKATAKSPGAATQYDKHLSANMKFLNVLSRYAECLSTATDTATATLAATKIEEITREAITAGEEVVKLGRPSADLEANLGKDADLQLTSQLVAEKTRAAVKSISENGEVKSVMAPAIENFQTALNRIQQTADDPRAPGDAGEKKPQATAAANPPAPVDPDVLPVKPDAGTASALPPPPPPQ